MTKIPSIPLTKDKLEALLKEQTALQEERREMVLHVQKAREMGDLSENGYYKASKSRLSQIDSHLYRNKELLKYGKLIEVAGNELVQIGSTVCFANSTQEKTLTLVSKFEANPMEGKISSDSPIGKALLGKKVAEEVQITTPSGKISYLIKNIS